MRNKFGVFIVLLSIILSCSACSINASNTLSESSEHNTKITTVPTSSQEISTPMSPSVTSQNQDLIPVYLASQSDGQINYIDDYETIMSLLSNATKEYIRASSYQEEGNFDPYIKNPNLLNYMHYRTQNPFYSYDRLREGKFWVAEALFEDQYVYVKAHVLGYGDGKLIPDVTHFIIKNENGRFYITEWYCDTNLSPDSIYRDAFSIEHNLNYWDNSSKYKHILEQIA